VSSSYLRRYTDIPALVYLLRERRITLLDPMSWDDSNDSSYLTYYREKKGLMSVLALCFTQANETYHHWRVFANGPSGVCISFKRAQLLKVLESHPNIKAEAVRYFRLPQARRQSIPIEDLPFVKRYPFEGENEFRLVYESKAKKVRVLDIPIPLSCIYKITLSPWLNRSLSGHLKRTLRSIDGCSALKIRYSTLIGNEEWKTIGESAGTKQ
jgi:hypothetical protein